jgi:Cu(I)/Ag(I) efflux system membrane protein CusA/SilA
MLIGLVPLLWARSSGADVMKRIAAPMVGGLVTSAFLTLEIIPAIVTYWRYEQLLWERLEPLDPRLLAVLKSWRAVIAAGAGLVVAVALASLYAEIPRFAFLGIIAVGAAAFVVGLVAYFASRPAARAQVWPV